MYYLLQEDFSFFLKEITLQNILNIVPFINTQIARFRLFLALDLNQVIGTFNNFKLSFLDSTTF